MYVCDRVCQFSIDRFHRMIDAGIFHRDDGVELIEWVLVTKMPKRHPRILVMEYLNEMLNGAVPGGWYVSMQNPITIPECGSEWEPDAKVVRGKRHDYEDRRVGPADVGLTVEVSDSLLSDDCVTKKQVYARSSIPACWIVNIPARRIEVYTDPTGPDPTPDYRRRSDYALGVEIPLVLDGIEVARIAVAEILPRK